MNISSVVIHIADVLIFDESFHLLARLENIRTKLINGVYDRVGGLDPGRKWIVGGIMHVSIPTFVFVSVKSKTNVVFVYE